MTDRNGTPEILVIDDDPDFLSSMKITLEGSGYSVVTAAGGPAGIERFRERRPDLVLCDIMMERIDSGILLAREIREMDRQVPLYLLSDIGDLTEENIDIHDLGCTGSIQKPVSPERLEEIVQQSLHHKGGGR